MCAVEPAPTQTTGCERSVRSTRIGRSAGSGNGATAPGAKPVAATTSGGRRHARIGSTGGGADLRRVGPPVAGDERDHGPAVAHEHERLHDLLERAADRVGRRLRGRRARVELLEPRLRARRAQVGGDTLDGLGPGHRRDSTVPPRSVEERDQPPPHAPSIGRVPVVRLARAAAPRAGAFPTQRHAEADRAGRAPGHSANRAIAGEEREATGVDRGAGRRRKGPLRRRALPRAGFGNGVNERPSALARPDRERRSPRVRAPLRPRTRAPARAAFGQSGGTKPGSRRSPHQRELRHDPTGTPPGHPVRSSVTRAR